MDFVDARHRLLERRDQLLVTLRRPGQDLPAACCGFSAPDRAEVEIGDLDELFKLDPGARAELCLIVLALNQIEAGDYGLCSRCAKAIDPERLRALPAAHLCAACAQRAAIATDLS
jgi:RNA polymerase-binding transcription factor DksA